MVELLTNFQKKSTSLFLIYIVLLFHEVRNVDQCINCVKNNIEESVQVHTLGVGGDFNEGLCRGIAEAGEPYSISFFKIQKDCPDFFVAGTIIQKQLILAFSFLGRKASPFLSPLCKKTRRTPPLLQPKTHCSQLAYFTSKKLKNKNAPNSQKYINKH